MRASMCWISACPGTEEIYFATFHLGVDGGIEVTASHNPMDYNGMKLVARRGSPDQR
ncbi:phosphomannomutase CpsG [Escherichia coli]|nr:phosphomannomutase CpsG [Escherichia coli]